MPPRLPPRSPSSTSSISSSNDQISPNVLPRENTIHLTPHAVQNSPYTYQTGLHDSRTSSTQSLRPAEAPGPYRRTLLIVYIHGFMGNETSFRSFPAHVHHLLSMTLSETHVVYTKIYPRYQSRKNISFARDAFSNWLSPHESDNTDVILVGHSLGGILGAEVVLLPSHTPGRRDAFQHRILGLIAFDTPFLGMHPGVVSTGIASLFRGSPEQTGDQTNPTSPAAASEVSIPLEEISSDPNYNPAYSNDVYLPVRTNKWEKAWYFMNKHYGDLRKATQSYVKSHLEFGGCLADYPGLRRRYGAVRALEDVDGISKQRNQEGRLLHRVRFVNYYTASTGRIKELKLDVGESSLTTSVEMQSLAPPPVDGLSLDSSRPPTPRLSLEEHREDGVVNKTAEVKIDEDTPTDGMLNLEPKPHEEPDPTEVSADAKIYDGLPAIPSEPIPPSPLDKSLFSDPDALQLAQKERARQTKAYERAIKDHQKAIRDRDKVIAKRQKQAQKEQDKAAKLAQQEEERLSKERIKRQSTLNPETQDQQLRDEATPDAPESDKKKRDRKFCTLPSKDQNGNRDPTWIRVYMEGMDEVVAHTSLFFVGDTYAKLVGDTAGRIEEWLNDDATTRALLYEEG